MSVLTLLLWVISHFRTLIERARGLIPWCTSPIGEVNALLSFFFIFFKSVRWSCCGKSTVLWLPASVPERRSEASFADASVTWKFYVSEHFIPETEFLLDKYVHPYGRCFIRKQPPSSSWQSLPVHLGFEACPVSFDSLLTFFGSIGILVMSQLFLALWFI